jgi:hypothetical protein
MGLPRAEIPLALLLFNVGVEIGQIGFVVVIVLLERAFRTYLFRPRQAASQRDRVNFGAGRAPSTPGNDV